MNPRLRLLVAVAGLAVAVSGCASSTEDEAKNTVLNYLDAIGDGDYDDACGLLSNSAKAKLRGGCEKALKQEYAKLPPGADNDFHSMDVRAVTVTGSTATVKPDDVLTVRSHTSGGRTTERRTRTTRRKAHDVTNGAGFTLIRSGDKWLISSVGP